tara:strand:+ start:581 stop:1828 length:1248 start_codon:yes stop_codon:yes gene_type:complete
VIGLKYECPKCNKQYDGNYITKNRYCEDCQMRLTQRREQAPRLKVKLRNNKDIEISIFDVWSFFKELDKAKPMFGSREFLVTCVVENSVIILPKDGRKRLIVYAEFLSVWCEYVKTRSEKVVDYVKISDNAPYILTVIILFLESKLAKKYHDSFNPLGEASEDKGKGVVYPKIVDVLVKREGALHSENVEFDSLTENRDSEILLTNLEKYPHAFVLASILHREVSDADVWDIPYKFMERLGSFEFHDIQKLSLEDVKKLMSTPLPLHMHPNAMAKSFYLGVQHIQERYSGKTSKIWADIPSSVTIVNRFSLFSGVNHKSAVKAAAILVRKFKIPVKDKTALDISVNNKVKRIFTRLGLISKHTSDNEIIEKAQDLYPPYPGVFESPIQEIGRKWCKPVNSDCISCYMTKYCPKVI